MSQRTRGRVAATTGFAVAVVSLGMTFAPSALAAGLPAVSAPGSVVAGEKFTVSGEGCRVYDEEYGAGVFIETDGRSQNPDEIFFGAESDAQGEWSAQISFPAGDRGAHMIQITCLNSYNGEEQEEIYPIVELQVTAPAAAPTTPPASVPGAIRGESANTAGVAPQTSTSASSTKPAPGQKVVKVYKGFQPFEVVTLTMHSTPQQLGTFTADANGVLTVEFTVPAGTPAGAHTLVLEGTTTYFQETLQVAGAPAPASSGSLADTGASIGVPLALGAGLLVAGGGALVATRRRPGATQA